MQAYFDTMVGDRGMITNVQIEAMRKLDGVDWMPANMTQLSMPIYGRLCNRGLPTIARIGRWRKVCWRRACWPVASSMATARP